MFPRKLIAVVAILLAVLLPVRGFAAQLIASCAMSGNATALHQMTVTEASAHDMPPCHEMQAQPADDDAVSMDDACSARCSACAASCSAPVLAPAAFVLAFSEPDTTTPIAADSTYFNAQLARADKPPVL